jgi:hypothetical protein
MSWEPDDACATLAASETETPPSAFFFTATDAPALIPHPLSRHFPRDAAVPLAGELQLWRFRCEWLPVPAPEGDAWLSKPERERARLHPNATLRKRFINARVAVRWIVGHLFDCAPRDIELRDDGGDRLRAHHPRDGRGISIDIAYGGIWIVLGIATTALGLSVVVPSPGLALDEPPEALRRRARRDSLHSALRDASVVIDERVLSSDEAASFTLEFARHGKWQMVDLPMGGKLRAAVVVAQPVARVWMIGWPKRTIR